jgi:hypothetical protein
MGTSMPDNQFSRAANNRLTFEMDEIPADGYRLIRDDIAATFHLVPDKPLISNGWDIAFQDYRRDEHIVGLEWDDWSGFLVVAQTQASEVQRLFVRKEMVEPVAPARWCVEFARSVGYERPFPPRCSSQ